MLSDLAQKVLLLFFLFDVHQIHAAHGYLHSSCVIHNHSWIERDLEWSGVLSVEWDHLGRLSLALSRQNQDFFSGEITRMLNDIDFVVERRPLLFFFRLVCLVLDHGHVLLRGVPCFVNGTLLLLNHCLHSILTGRVKASFHLCL